MMQFFKILMLDSNLMVEENLSNDGVHESSQVNYNERENVRNQITLSLMESIS